MNLEWVFAGAQPQQVIPPLINIEKIMNKIYVIGASIIIGISLSINVFLLLQNHFQTILIDEYKNSESVYIDERSVINELIPKMKPTITKEKFVEVLKSIIPDEKVDVLDDQIGWRFYHFWYSKDGKITDVTYGS